MRVARYDGSTAYYFHNDHLGRPVALTDVSGAVAWQVDYLPFGKVYAVVNNRRIRRWVFKKNLDIE